jgi:predicted ATPase
MIRQVRYRNFKGLRHVDLDLERLTVIVGPNASGKTSVLEGLEYLYRVGHPTLGKTHPSLIYNRGGQSDLELIASESAVDYRIRVSPPTSTVEDGLQNRPSNSDQESWPIEIEVRKSHDPSIEWQTVWEARIPETPFYTAPRFPELKLDGMPSVLLHLDATRLAAPSYSETHPPSIDPQGAGLASTLAYIALNQPDDFQRLQESFRGIVPSVRRIRFDRSLVIQDGYQHVEVNGERLHRHTRSQYWGNSIVLDMKGGGTIPGTLASEGTMLVLGILTAIMGPARPKLILLDDLERGLHPRAQENLVVFLRRFLDQNPGTQIVATTHSPLLLNHVRPQEVRLTTLKADGTTACGRLDEHPEFDEWKDAMAPGEFWSLIGEGWLKESRTEERV